MDAIVLTLFVTCLVWAALTIGYGLYVIGRFISDRVLYWRLERNYRKLYSFLDDRRN